MEFEEETDQAFDEFINKLCDDFEIVFEMDEEVEHRLMKMKCIFTPPPRAALDKLRMYIPHLI